MKDREEAGLSDLCENATASSQSTCGLLRVHLELTEVSVVDPSTPPLPIAQLALLKDTS